MDTDLKEELVETGETSSDIDFSEIVDSNNEVNENLNKVIDLLTEQNETNNADSVEDVLTVDYTEQLNQIIDLLHYQQESTNIIVLYGLVLVPLCIVVIALWWFFKQFIYKYS